MKRYAVFIIILFSILTFSCRITKCIDPYFSISFKGFDSTELTQIHLKIFEKNTDHIVTDSLINLEYADKYHPEYGSQGIAIQYDNYDYSITLSNKEYKLTNFKKKQNSVKEIFNGGEVNACSNDITFKLNGVDKSTVGETACSGSSLYCWVNIKIEKE